MTIEETIIIDGTEYPVTLSDERKTLLMAKAAGRVVVGIGKGVETGKKDPDEWLPVNFVTDALPVDEDWLEGVVRREAGLPWIIACTERLIIREFTLNDCVLIPDDADDSPDEAILKDPETLAAYIDGQYKFFDCGMWALVRKEDGKLVGTVSLTPASSPVRGFCHEDVSAMEYTDSSGTETGDQSADHSETADDIRISAATKSRAGKKLIYVCAAAAESGEYCALGYHIYTPYRRQGYAREACGRILELLSERDTGAVAYTESENSASIALLKDLGFAFYA